MDRETYDKRFLKAKKYALQHGSHFIRHNWEDFASEYVFRTLAYSNISPKFVAVDFIRKYASRKKEDQASKRKLNWLTDIVYLEDGTADIFRDKADILERICLKHDVLEPIMNELEFYNDIEKDVFIRRVFKDETNKQICKDYNVTESRISQIFASVCKKIRAFYDEKENAKAG